MGFLYGPYGQYGPRLDFCGFWVPSRMDRAWTEWTGTASVVHVGGLLEVPITLSLLVAMMMLSLCSIW